MAGIYVITLALAVTGMLFPGFAEAQPTNQVESPGAATVVVSATNSGRLIYLSPGQTLEVRLMASPRNDFTWSVMPVSRPVLRQENRSSQPGADPQGGGLDLWRFTATERGRQTLRFEYRRPGELKAGKIIFYRIIVH